MADIGVEDVLDFQKLFLERMRASHSDILDELGRGIVSDRAEDIIKKVAAEVCLHLGK